MRTLRSRIIQEEDSNQTNNEIVEQQKKKSKKSIKKTGKKRTKAIKKNDSKIELNSSDKQSMDNNLSEIFKNAITSTAIKPQKSYFSKKKAEDNEISDNIQTNKKRGKKKNNQVIVEDLIEEPKEKFKKQKLTKNTQKVNDQLKNDDFKNKDIILFEDEELLQQQSHKRTTPKKSQVDKKQNEYENSLDQNISSKAVSNLLDSTFVKENNSTFDKEETIKLVNTSGDWKIENINLDETITKESVKAANNISPNNKNIRKKWLKLERFSEGANLLTKQILTPSRNLKTSTQSVKKVEKLNSVTKSPTANKSTRKAIPNFAEIHKKAFEKMENLEEYTARKKERAKMLMSSSKTTSVSKQIKPAKLEQKKPFRQLFKTNDKSPVPEKLLLSQSKYNRFGFKITENEELKNINKKSNITQTAQKFATKKSIPVQKEAIQPLKPSVFTKPNVLQIANKNKNCDLVKQRENKRDTLKGVRINRRFELLMKMREKQ